MHTFFKSLGLIGGLLLGGCGAADEAAAPAAPIPADAASAVVAGGCFWCVEKDFEHLPGVHAVVSGYSGGTNENATYKSHEGHREAVEIFYDPSVVSYEELMRRFVRSIDVTDAGGQFCDRGYAYSTAIYYKSEAERAAADAAVAEAATHLQQPVVTAVEAFKFITKAEEYHQDYYKKNPARYSYYRNSCGRDKRIKALWGDEAWTLSH